MAVRWEDLWSAMPPITFVLGLLIGRLIERRDR